MPAHESMEDMLAKIRDGWTVKARFKTRDGHVIIEGTVRADEKFRWYGVGVPGWAIDPHPLVPLCQITGSLPNGDLVEVVSASPPPVYTNTTDTEYLIGDEVASAFDPDSVHRWSFHGDINSDGYTWRLVAGEPVDWSGDRAKVEFKREGLPEKLRLVGRVQPWPLPACGDHADEFATAQRMMAKQIRDIRPSAGALTPMDARKLLDQAAYKVEHFDLDDDTWQ